MADKKNTRIEFSIEEIIYYLFFAVMLTAKGLGLYDGQWPYTLSLVIGAVLIVCKLTISDMTLMERLWTLLLLFMGATIFACSGEKGALIYIAMIVGMKNVDLKRVFKLGLAIWILTSVFESMITLTGLSFDIFKVQEKLGLGYIMRWSLGQPHPNVLEISLMMLCAFILFLGNFKGKELIKVSACMFIIILYGFLYSVSYTGFGLAIIYLLLNIYLSGRDRLNKAEKILANMVFPVSMLFSILGPLYFPEKLWNLCNKILNTRFYLGKNYMENVPFTLFGIRWEGYLSPSVSNLDSSYVYALMHYGIVFFVIFVAAYIALIAYEVKKNELNKLAITLGLSIAAISEPFFVNSSFKNISMLFLGEFLFIASTGFADQHKNSILAKKIGLTSIGQRTIKIDIEKPMAVIYAYTDAFKKNIKKILLVAVCAGIVGGIVYALLIKMPDAYYVNLYDVQNYLWDRAVFLDINNLPADFAGKILSYTGPESPLMVIDGNSIKLEFVRGLVSSVMWTGFYVCLIFTGAITAFYRKK